MKIICPKCGIIHDEDFAPCKSTLSLPAPEDAPRNNCEELAAQEQSAAALTEEAPCFQTLERAQATAAGAGAMGVSVAAPERDAAAAILPERLAEDRAQDRTAPGRTAAADEPEWRREVAERLESYRARRRKYHPLDMREVPDDSQPLLALAPEKTDVPRADSAIACSAKGQEDHPNGKDSDRSSGGGLPVVEFAAPELVPGEAEYVRRRAALRIAARPRRDDRMDITVMQPRFDFSVNEAPTLHPQDEMRPVADLCERRLAGLVDASILGAACAGFFVLFRQLGGEFSLSRFSVAACLASAYLVYAQYFVLFTVFIGVTPGMMLRGLELLTLDGHAPSTRHLLWRSFGYLLSAAAAFLGFLWALWDDDHLTWQDRVSQTYVTPAMEAARENLAARAQES